MFSILLLLFSFLAEKIIQNKVRVPIVQSKCRIVAKVVLMNFKSMSWVRKVRKTYLTTCRRANESICPDRETFSRLILESFQKSKSWAKVLQLLVCREPHKSKGIHYHMCIKFDCNQRWSCSKQHLLSAHKVSVHFSENHANYMAAYCCL